MAVQADAQDARVRQDAHVCTHVRCRLEAIHVWVQVMAWAMGAGDGVGDGCDA